MSTGLGKKGSPSQPPHIGLTRSQWGNAVLGDLLLLDRSTAHGKERKSRNGLGVLKVVHPDATSRETQREGFWVLENPTNSRQSNLAWLDRWTPQDLTPDAPSRVAM